MNKSTKTFIRDLIVLVFIVTGAFVVTRDANASTNVRCYFPGYSEVFKDVQNITRRQLDTTIIKFMISSKEYTVPVNACVVEEDL